MYNQNNANAYGTDFAKSSPHQAEAPLVAGDHYDSELGSPFGSQYIADAEKSIRHGFIRKVYLILTMQLLITFGIIFGTYSSDSARFYIKEHPAVLFVAIGVILVSMIAMVCFPSARRRFPQNYIFLGAFTVAEAYLLTSITCYLDADVLIMATGFTITIFVALSLFSLQTKFDLTGLAMGVFVIMSTMLFFAISMIWWHSRAALTVYAALGAMAFAFIIVIDTQLWLSGKHIPVMVDEYVFVALNLYLDVINLFIYIAALLSNGRR